MVVRIMKMTVLLDQIVINGKSPSNQVSVSHNVHCKNNVMAVTTNDNNRRIEAFWSQVRKSVTDWWIHFLKEFQRWTPQQYHLLPHVRK